MPSNKILNKGEIWILADDIEYNAFDELSFSFNRENDTIISKSYLGTLNIIKDRRPFLEINNNLDESKTEFIFIESTNCNKFILRKVRPIIFE